MFCLDVRLDVVAIEHVAFWEMNCEVDRFVFNSRGEGKRHENNRIERNETFI